MKKFILLGLLAFFFHFSNPTDKIMVANLSWENCNHWSVPVECVVCGLELDPSETYTYEFDGDPEYDHYWEVRWIPARQYWDYEPDIHLFFKEQHGKDIHFYLAPGEKVRMEEANEKDVSNWLSVPNDGLR